VARPAPRHVRPHAPPVAPETPVHVRFLTPDDASALSAVIERSYGDSYDCRWVYDQGEVRRRLVDGTLRSVVGEADGRIVGHLGLTRRHADAPVGEAGQAVVDPAFRGHHVFETLKRALADDSREHGLLGMYSEATAAHPYSQKANLALGARETGFLLGYIPASVEYTDIEKRAQGRRQSAALFYLATNPDALVPLHPPPWHRAIVTAITSRNDLRRELGASPPSRLRGRTELDVDAHPDHAEAFVTVRHLGLDAVDTIAASVSRLAESNDCIYLDLRLADPSTARLPREVHDELGFFFGGLIPHLADGDVLRLQYLHDVDADPSDVAVASDFGGELLAYVFERRAGIGTLQ